jgi:putative copper resistance protein D
MLDGTLPAAVIRWGTFAALLVTIGAVAFRVLVLGRLARRPAPAAPASDVSGARLLDDHERWVAAWGLVSAVALVPLAAGRLGIQVAELRDPAEPWTVPASVMLLETTWGVGWWLQVGAALLCAIGFLVVRGRYHDGPGGPGGLRRVRRMGWTAVTLGAVALAATPALSGHAAGSPRLSTLAVVGDTLHVLGAGAWLGSLAIAMVTVAGRRRATGPGAVAAVIQAFSPVALAAAAVVVASGILASWLHMDAVASLWTTTYGQLLAVKILLFAFVVALGAFNWRRVTPHLGSDGGVRQLRASARAELAAALLVLLVTAVLVATPLPGEG